MKIVVTKNEYTMMEDGSIYIDLNITNQPVQSETKKKVDHFESGKTYRLAKGSCFLDRHRQVIAPLDAYYVGIRGNHYYFENVTKVPSGDLFGSRSIKVEKNDIDFNLIIEI